MGFVRGMPMQHRQPPSHSRHKAPTATRPTRAQLYTIQRQHCVPFWPTSTSGVPVGWRSRARSAYLAPSGPWWRCCASAPAPTLANQPSHRALPWHHQLLLLAVIVAAVAAAVTGGGSGVAGGRWCAAAVTVLRIRGPGPAPTARPRCRELLWPALLAVRPQGLQQDVSPETGTRGCQLQQPLSHTVPRRAALVGQTAASTDERRHRPLAHRSSTPRPRRASAAPTLPSAFMQVRGQ